MVKASRPLASSAWPITEQPHPPHPLLPQRRQRLTPRELKEMEITTRKRQQRLQLQLRPPRELKEMEITTRKRQQRLQLQLRPPSSPILRAPLLLPAMARVRAREIIMAKVRLLQVAEKQSRRQL